MEEIMNKKKAVRKEGKIPKIPKPLRVVHESIDETFKDIIIGSVEEIFKEGRWPEYVLIDSPKGFEFIFKETSERLRIPDIIKSKKVKCPRCGHKFPLKGFVDEIVWNIEKLKVGY